MPEYSKNSKRSGVSSDGTSFQWITKSYGVYTGGGGGGGGGDAIIVVDALPDNPSATSFYRYDGAYYVWNGAWKKIETDEDFEKLVKVMPTEIVRQGASLRLAHDGEILTGQDKTFTFDSEPTAASDNIVTSGGVKTYVDAKVATKADLVDGKVPASQLPSYVDDVVEYDNLEAFPETGEDGKIYIAKDTNKTYRWSGTTYVQLDSGLVLGETSETAYAGDKGVSNRKDIDDIIAGDITVGEAEVASNDALGNNINEYYAPKTSLDGKLDKVTTTGAKRAYVVNSDGTQDTLGIATSSIGIGFLTIYNKNRSITVASTPVDDTDAASKGYVDTTAEGKLDKVTTTTGEYQAYVKAPDGTQAMSGVSNYIAQGNLAVWGAGGKLKTNTPTENTDCANKKYVDDHTGGDVGVVIDALETATNGTLTADQLATLQADETNYIMFNHEKYYLMDKGHIEGYLTYTHVGYENNTMWLKSITVTISTLGWVLNVVAVRPTEVLSQNEYDALETKDSNTIYYITE